jgi:hypothetical protein
MILFFSGAVLGFIVGNVGGAAVVSRSLVGQVIDGVMMIRFFFFGRALLLGKPWVRSEIIKVGKDDLNH